MVPTSIRSERVSSRNSPERHLKSPKIASRLAWQAVASEVMMNESEWKDQYDRVELEKLRFIEEQLESLLEEHQKSIGYGPAGQGPN
jgi:hypothetical protein